MSKLSDDEKLLCTPVIDYLFELGYTMKKRKKNSFIIEFNYTKVFQDAVNHRCKAWVERGQQWQPMESACCAMCKGKPRFYHYTREDGTSFDGCGGYTKLVPGVTSKDVPEILRLIKEQDEYFNEMFA